MRIHTKDVLKTIAVGGLVVSAAAIPAVPIAIAFIYKQYKYATKSDVGRIVKRLEKQEMLHITEVEGTVLLEITEKGKRRLLKYDYEQLERKVVKRDGAWRLIIFDIPEKDKRSRNAFVKKLLQLDCIRLQDSVYASAYPCKDEIDFLCHFLEISDYVTVISLDKIERGEQLFFKEIKEDFI